MLKNIRGETPLDLASQFGHLDTVSAHSICGTVHKYMYLIVFLVYVIVINTVITVGSRFDFSLS